MNSRHNGADDYGDIIGAERPAPRNHRPMARAERAKQFMPFATLRGYGDILADREIGSDSRAEGDDDGEALLNEALSGLRRALDAGLKPEIRLQVYETDRSLRLHVTELKGRAERLSEAERTLRISGRTIPLDDIRFVSLTDDGGES